MSEIKSLRDQAINNSRSRRSMSKILRHSIPLSQGCPTIVAHSFAFVKSFFKKNFHFFEQDLPKLSQSSVKCPGFTAPRGTAFVFYHLSGRLSSVFSKFFVFVSLDNCRQKAFGILLHNYIKYSLFLPKTFLLPKIPKNSSYYFGNVRHNKENP